jgi:DNA-directed RNA polymerase subunit RPC12/RpoP
MFCSSSHALFMWLSINTKKVYNCFYCGAKIIFDEAVRSEKTKKRLPLNLEDSMLHECAAFYSVNNSHEVSLSFLANDI